MLFFEDEDNVLELFSFVFAVSFGPVIDFSLFFKCGFGKVLGLFELLELFELFEKFEEFEETVDTG